MRRSPLIAVALACCATTAAHAGFKLTIAESDDFGANAPVLTLENTSATERLDTFSLSIGDTAYNFDRITAPDDADAPLAEATIAQGDFPDGGERVDTLELQFPADELAAGSSISWLVDIDLDGGDSSEDFRTVLFNNGSGVANAVAAAVYGDDSEQRITLADGPGDLASYTFATPLPAALPLFAGGLAGIGFVLHRRRRATV
jgi:hypothetical protein